MRKPARNNSSGAINFITKPKRHFIANVAARYRDQTLAEFIECAIDEALDPQRMLQRDEPNYGTGPVFKAEPTLWGDSLWHEDEAVRVFRLAVFDARLMTPSMKAIWLEFSTAMAKEGKKINQQNFVAYCNELEKEDN